MDDKKKTKQKKSVLKIEQFSHTFSLDSNNHLRKPRLFYVEQEERE